MDKALEELIYFFKCDLKAAKGAASNGNQFEEFIKEKLRKRGFIEKKWKTTSKTPVQSKTSLSDVLKEKIKKLVLEKTNIQPIDNKSEEQYIYISAFWFPKFSWLSGFYQGMNFTFRN